MAKIKLLCTGSAGFIFSNFIRYALKNSADYQIISVDKFSTKSLNSIYRNKSHIVHIGDVTDPHFIDMIFTLEQPDYVIHGAAELYDPSLMTYSNIIGTKVIIDACLKHKVKKLIYTSTYEDSTYNLYSATKAAGELLIQTSGLVYNILRPCENYGPKQQISNFIPSIIANILHNNEVVLNGKENQIRDLIHVQDTCSAILCILSNAKDNETYEISAKQEFTDIEIFQKICTILNRGNELLSLSNSIEHGVFNKSNNKLKELGWFPQFKLREGLEHTVMWYVNNSWYKD
jgi:dTDP-glucose 4,6-dehydratase